MDTPICDFVDNYNKMSALRFHMPGHKGNFVLGAEPFDITEISGADVLYSCDGIIMRSQNNASKMFGSERTIYSTEGSSLCIRAMVYMARLIASEEGKKPVILALRNAHKTFVSAAAILNVSVKWLSPHTDSLFCGRVDLCELEKEICETNPAAVYLTSPDYLGNIADIKAVSDICHRHNTVLMVDNAHGAYLKFLEGSLHPLDLGADICSDSAHKTLPVLTPGAYLHISKTAPKLLNTLAETAMSYFASTSPSYLILQSLDRANVYLENEISCDMALVLKSIKKLKEELINQGFALIGDEPLKLTIAPKEYGYSGFELAKILEKENIICEFADPDYVVMMFSSHTKQDEIKRLKNALKAIPKRQRIEIKPPKLELPNAVMTPHEAIFSVGEWVETSQSKGRVLASPCVNCPPAIPIAVCGEEITESVANSFQYYGINKVLCTKISK